MLLYQVGTETQQIFEMLANTGEDYDTAKTKLNECFSPKKVTYEIYKFQQATQQAGKSVKQFAIRLRQLAANCGFPYVDKEITSVIVQHLPFKHLRQFALRESKLTLDNLLSKARSLESSETQAAGIELRAHRPPQSEEDISSVKGYYKKRPNSHIRGNGRPHLLARFYTPTPVEM